MSALINSCLEACQEAYHPSDDGNYTLFFPQNIVGVARSLKLEGQKYLQIAIAGSNDLLDWRDNFLWQETSHGFHYGWYQAYKKARKDIQVLLKHYPDLPLILTGHSAGAAIIAIAACVLSRYKKIKLVTFAAPRFCTEKNLKRLAKCERIAIAHWLDPVVYVPFNFELLPVQREWWWGNPHQLPVISNQ